MLTQWFSHFQSLPLDVIYTFSSLRIPILAQPFSFWGQKFVIAWKHYHTTCFTVRTLWTRNYNGLSNCLTIQEDTKRVTQDQSSYEYKRKIVLMIHT